MQSVHSECNYFGLVRWHPNTSLEEICTRKKPCLIQMSQEFNLDVSGSGHTPYLGPKIVARHGNGNGQWSCCARCLLLKFFPMRSAFLAPSVLVRKLSTFGRILLIAKICVFFACVSQIRGFVYVTSKAGMPGILRTEFPIFLGRAQPFWDILTLFLIASFSYLVSMENH